MIESTAIPEWLVKQARAGDASRCSAGFWSYTATTRE